MKLSKEFVSQLIEYFECQRFQSNDQNRSIRCIVVAQK